MPITNIVEYTQESVTVGSILHIMIPIAHSSRKFLSYTYKQKPICRKLLK